MQKRAQSSSAWKSKCSKQTPLRAWNGRDRLREYRPNRQVLRQRRVQTEQRKDRNLRQHREAITDRDVGQRLDQRHAAKLLHAAAGSRSNAN